MQFDFNDETEIEQSQKMYSSYRYTLQRLPDIPAYEMSMQNIC